MFWVLERSINNVVEETKRYEWLIHQSEEKLINDLATLTKEWICRDYINNIFVLESALNDFLHKWREISFIMEILEDLKETNKWNLTYKEYYKIENKIFSEELEGKIMKIDEIVSKIYNFEFDEYSIYSSLHELLVLIAKFNELMWEDNSKVNRNLTLVENSLSKNK